MIVIGFSLLLSSNGQNRMKPEVLSYELEVGFYPDARMDYAGFIAVLEGQRPEWNKEDSIQNYPHMKGKASMWIDLGSNPGEILEFFIHGELKAHHLKLDGNNLKFKQESIFYSRSYSLVANRITVRLNGLAGKQLFELTYGGMFNPCYSSSPSNYMRIDSQGAYLRALGYSLWFPVLVKPDDDTDPVDFSQVKIITPKKFMGVFTGRRISDTIQGGQRQSLWKAGKIELWNAQVTVRPFIISEKKGIFLYHMDHPKSITASQDIFTFVNQLLVFYSEHYRKIESTPQLHVAELPNFASGISSGNMIGMTSGQWRRFNLKDDDLGMELLVSHELVHTFVRPEISLSSPLAALFVEGFPSYFHFPALARILGEEWYQQYIRRVEASYLKKKQTGKNYRGGPLPEEKPILSLTFDDIGQYKDTFILNDRVRLFLNYIRDKAGKKQFKDFTRELCHSRNLIPEAFINLIEKYVPGSEKDIRLWLETNDYPKKLRLKNIN